MTRSLLVEQFNNFILTRSFLVCQCFIQFVFQYFHRHWFVPVFQIYFNMTRKRWYQVLFPSVRSVHAQLPTAGKGVFLHWGLSCIGDMSLGVCFPQTWSRKSCVTLTGIWNNSLSHFHFVTLSLLSHSCCEKRRTKSVSSRRTLRGRARECLSVSNKHWGSEQSVSWVLSRQTLRGRAKTVAECVPGEHWQEGWESVWVFPTNT